MTGTHLTHSFQTPGQEPGCPGTSTTDCLLGIPLLLTKKPTYPVFNYSFDSIIAFCITGFLLFAYTEEFSLLMTWTSLAIYSALLGIIPWSLYVLCLPILERQ